MTVATKDWKCFTIPSVSRGFGIRGWDKIPNPSFCKIIG